MPFSQRNHPIQTLLLDKSDKPLPCALQFGAWNGVCTTRTADSSSKWRTGALHFRSRSRSGHGSGPAFRRRAPSLCAAAWIMNASFGCGVRPHLHAARRQLNDEHGVRHESAPRPHFGREEIRAGNRAPMGPQKRLPGSRPRRHRGNALRFQNPGNRRSPHSVANVLEGPRECACSPRLGFLRQSARRVAESP